MNISFIIPCLNCSKFIGNTIKKLIEKLKKNRIIDFEIILIDDGSTDKTLEILKKHASKNKKQQQEETLTKNNEWETLAISKEQLRKTSFSLFFCSFLCLDP